MRIRVTSKAKSQAQSTTPTSSVDELVRKLVNQAIHSDPSSDTQTTNVLLDTEIEGVRCVLTRPSAPPPRPVLAARDAVHLSPREREIARMVAQGHPNKVIADVLEISLWTVSTHLRRMFAKFGVTSRAAMVASAISAGLLNDPTTPEPRGPRAR